MSGGSRDAGRFRVIALIAIVGIVGPTALGGCGDREQATSTSRPEPRAGRAGNENREPIGKPVISARAERAFAAIEAVADGSIGVAVAPIGAGEPEVLGGLVTAHAWSTIKVPILVTLIADRNGSENLTGPESAAAEAALTASDNDAAALLFGSLEQIHGDLEAASAAVTATLRRAGDQETVVGTVAPSSGFSAYGQTDWSAAASARFYASLAGGCLLGGADTEFVLSLMRRVIPDQSWGLGEVTFADSKPVGFKGGWGPEPDGAYLVRQGGIVESRHRGYAISIITEPSGISGEAGFLAGQDLVGSVASWAATELGSASKAAAPAC